MGAVATLGLAVELGGSWRRDIWLDGTLQAGLLKDVGERAVRRHFSPFANACPKCVPDVPERYGKPDFDMISIFSSCFRTQTSSSTLSSS